jgi:hypothetical protein
LSRDSSVELATCFGEPASGAHEDKPSNRVWVVGCEQLGDASTGRVPDHVDREVERRLDGLGVFGRQLSKGHARREVCPAVEDDKLSVCQLA